MMNPIVLIIVFLSAAYSQFDTNMAVDRQTMVHMFCWTWSDVAQECESYLGPNGFGGVQVSPPNDHAIISDPFRPWWERYQVVGYNLTSRSGDDDAFRDMVHRCNNANVRIYVDAVVNHMAFFGGESVGGIPYDPGNLYYPTVPYTEEDFSAYYGLCNTTDYNIENTSSVNQLRDCNLLALKDLAQHEERVRGKISEYLNYMIDTGVAGFRFDAAKHMWPEDLGNIYGRLHDLSTDYFDAGSRAFIVHEVIDKGGDPVRATEYTDLGRVTEFNYGPFVAEAVRREIPFSDLETLGASGPWTLLPSGKALAFLDNHDNQRGGDKEDQVTYKDARDYRMANAFMLAWPYGAVRLMSSYQFATSDDGPPTDLSGRILTPVTDDSEQCVNGWICEHRWPVIKKMVTFRNVVGDSPVTNWWDNGNNQIAFGRGEKGFLAINNEADEDLDTTLMTGLPEGDYCDVIMGEIDDEGKCTGPTIAVDEYGYAEFIIRYDDDNPMVAIHTDATVTGGVATGVVSCTVVCLSIFASLVVH
ncbi:alpha-amylase 4N-like isoform X3 [Apostichopus japonicus]|uniref:alpha-amylase 4N-like isoform X3 n=1 Tax=Stichopus japonicus TaxID=307972 RepID=UPI003AB2BED6